MVRFSIIKWSIFHLTNTFTLLKLLLWIPYDAFNFAFASMIGRIITVISTIVGMIRLDRKKEKVDLDKIEWKNND